MDSQTLNTIIIALATLIAALSGTLVTYFINSKKNRVELKLKKLDYLIEKKEILENAKKKYMKIMKMNLMRMNHSQIELK